MLLYFTLTSTCGYNRTTIIQNVKSKLDTALWDLTQLPEHFTTSFLLFGILYIKWIMPDTQKNKKVFFYYALWTIKIATKLLFSLTTITKI